MTLKDADKIKEAIKNSDDFVGGSDDIIRVIDSVPEVVIDTDTISRKAAIEALVAETIYTEEELREYYEANSHRNEWVNGIYEAVEAIKQLPPAQPASQPWEVLAAQAVLPQPKMGKWIYHIDDLFPAESTMECNQCHAEQPLTCDDEFCPHCGAKMEATE